MTEQTQLSDDEAWHRQMGQLIDSEKPAPRPRTARSPKVTYVAIDPAGVEHTRAAETTVYTHLVVILAAEGQRWQIWGWAQSKEAADRLHAQARPRYADVAALTTKTRSTP